MSLRLHTFMGVSPTEHRGTRSPILCFPSFQGYWGTEMATARSYWTREATGSLCWGKGRNISLLHVILCWPKWVRSKYSDLRPCLSGCGTKELERECKLWAAESAAVSTPFSGPVCPLGHPPSGQFPTQPSVAPTSSDTHCHPKPPFQPPGVEAQHWLVLHQCQCYSATAHSLMALLQQPEPVVAAYHYN